MQPVLETDLLEIIEQNLIINESLITLKLAHETIDEYVDTEFYPRFIPLMVNYLKKYYNCNRFKSIVAKETGGVFVISAQAYTMLMRSPMNVQIINDVARLHGYRIINTDCYDPQPCKSCRTYLSKDRCPGVFVKIMLLRELLGKDERSIVIGIYHQLNLRTP